MVIPHNFHSFETRLVRTPDGLMFLRLSKDKEGKLYFISKNPISCIISSKVAFEKFIKELITAYDMDIVELKDIHIISS